MNQIIDKLSHKKVLKGLNCRNIDFTSKFSGDCVYFLINHIHWDNWCRSPTNIHKVNHSLYELNVYVISNKCSLLPEVPVPHCSPEKQFKSINTFAQLWFTIAMIKFWRRRILNSVNVFSLYHYFLPLEKGLGLYLNELESLCPCAKFGWNIGHVDLEKKFLLNFVNVFLLFCYYLPLERAW